MTYGPYLRYNETRQYNAMYQLTMKDWVTGEEVTYTYDALNRLASATTTGLEWGQAYMYDGFGNLLQQNVTKGTAPSLNITVNPANNRVNGVSYDANGNDTPVGTYDVLNRLIAAGGAEYGYAPDNKRIWKKKPADRRSIICGWGISGSGRPTLLRHDEEPAVQRIHVLIHAPDFRRLVLGC